MANQWLLLKALIHLQGTRSLHAARSTAATGRITDTVELRGSESAAPPADSAGNPPPQLQPTAGIAPAVPPYGEAAYRALGESPFARLNSGAAGTEGTHPDARVAPAEPDGARAAHTPIEGTPHALLSHAEYAPHQASRWVTLARHRKLHPFISEHLLPGDGYTLFDYLGCRFGVLTCYDNNLIENVRVTALMGAEVVLMPHVTGCLPSPMPGRGTVDRSVWENREADPVRCRMEFNGPKGRGWLMHWLPARAYDNGVYAVFSNPIGVDGDTIKPGNAMIFDPYGEVLAECHELGDDVVVALLTPEKLQDAPGRRYIRARRPERRTRPTT